MAAYGKTYLQIINAILPRLRRATVASNGATAYSLQVGAVVNSIKTEIEKAWMWRNLRDTYDLTAVPGTTLYTFTNSGPEAKIIDMWNTTSPGQMTRGTFASFNEKFFGVTSVTLGAPTEFLPTGVNASNDLQVNIWPSPNATNAIKANLYVPQDDLAADATVPLVPQQVLIEGAIAYLLAERGDDNGTAAQGQQGRYMNMLADAIAAEAGEDPSEVDWDAS